MQWMNSSLASAQNISVDSWAVTGGTYQHITVSPDPTGTVVLFNSFESLGWYDGAIGFEPTSDGNIILKTNKGRVGVKIHVPVRVSDIGTPPYYQVFIDTTGSTPVSWNTPVLDPSQKYTFPVDQVGYNITINPQATAETLYLTINTQAA
jgi:hypothetical protein